MSDATFFLAMPLRYYPDLTTGEFLNVGIALVCPDAGWWDLRVLTQMRRVSRLFPTAQVESVSRVLSHVVDRISAYKRKQGPSVELAFAPGEPFALVKQIVGETIGALRWSEGDVIEGVTEHPESELNRLFETMIHAGRRSRGGEDELGRPATATTVARDELTALMRFEFQARDVWRRLQPVTIESYTPHTFRYAYQNGHLHVFEPISLLARTPERVFSKGETWRGRLDRLTDYASSRRFSFYALIQLPEGEELRERAEAAVKMIEHANVDVTTFTANRVADLGRVAQMVIEEGGAP